MVKVFTTEDMLITAKRFDTAAENMAIEGEPHAAGASAAMAGIMRTAADVMDLEADVPAPLVHVPALRPGQSYFIQGPQGTGKTSLAQIIAVTLGGRFETRNRPGVPENLGTLGHRWLGRVLVDTPRIPDTLILDGLHPEDMARVNELTSASHLKAETLSETEPDRVVPAPRFILVASSSLRLVDADPSRYLVINCS